MAKRDKRKEKKEQSKEQTFNLGKCLRTGLIVYGIVVVAAVMYYYKYYFTIHFGITSPTPKLINEVLDKHVEFATTLLAQADTIKYSLESLESDLQESRIRDVIQVIQNRVTSIRKQTSIYEKMERIPGGPKSFIESSLSELDDILEKLYGVHEYNYIVISEVQDKLKTMQKEINTINTENLIYNSRRDVKEYFDMSTIPFFIPITEEEKKMMGKLDMDENIYWLEETLQTVVELSELYLRVLEDEEVLNAAENERKAKENEDQEDPESEENVDGDEPAETFRDFFEYKRDKYEEIRFFYLSYHRLIQDIEESIQNFWKNVAKGGQNYISDKLKNEIRWDCEDLKVRLKNLQH